MNQILVSILLLCFWVNGSCRNKRNYPTRSNDIICPDSAQFHKNLKSLSRYYYQDTIDNSFEQIQKEFAQSLDYLQNKTKLKSHVYAGYVFIYLKKEDYLKDSIQYKNWFVSNCSRASN